MKSAVRFLLAAALLAALFLPLVAGCALNKGKQPRPMETVDDFMMLSKPEKADR